jgi:hypothetical protein
MSQCDTKQIPEQKIKNNSKKMVNNEDYPLCGARYAGR